MGFREVKPELSKLEKADLIKHIAELYNKYKPVKEYFDFYINPNEKELLEQYKEKVTEGFFPKRGCQLKLSISRKAISDFKKLGPSPESVADLLLHYVEQGVEFSNEYGDISESFYTSGANTYASALEIISKNGLLDKFKTRAYKVLTDSDDIGWDFPECIGEFYYQYYD